MFDLYVVEVGDGRQVIIVIDNQKHMFFQVEMKLDCTFACFI